MSADKIYDAIVIGAGPGGYHAAIRASQLGLSVAIAEKDDGSGIGGVGGVCLNWGCIPSKALLKNAELLYQIKDDAWGFNFTNLKADMSKAVKRSRNVSKRLTQGVEYLFKKNSIEVFKGKAELESSTKVNVDGGDVLTAKNIVIATGARPRDLPGFEIDGEKVISYRQALELKDAPKRIAIIGASAIGCEFAYYFNAYGSQVTLFELADRIVPKEDRDISRELERQFKKLGIKSVVGANVAAVAKKGAALNLKYAVNDKSQSLDADVVMLGVGVQPNSDDIGLEKVNVAGERGFITVNGNMQTNVAGVYAVGDVTGKLQLAHVAFEQGIVAAETIAGKRPQPIETYHEMPRCTYCQPEIASIGYTEDEAREQGFDIKVAKAPFAAAGKSIAIGHPEGFIKLVVDKRFNEVLGAHIIGANATEMIAEIGLLKYLEGTSDELHRLTHAHPTLSEVIGEVGGAVIDRAIHM